MTEDKGKFFKSKWVKLFSLVSVVLTWELVADFLVKNSFFLPSFSAVVLAFLKLWKIIPLDILVSFLHFGIGLLVAIIVGVVFGVLMGWFKAADKIFGPLVEIIRPIPPIAWVVFAVIWFGLSHFAASFVVFIGAVFPILINTYAGLKSVPKTLVQAAQVLGCKDDSRLIKYIAFPSALPLILTGIRIGMGVGWMCVVAAEMFGVSRNGLGFRLYQRFYSLHQIDNLVLYMIILGLMALLFDRAFRYFVEGKLLKWQKGLVVLEK